MASINQHPAFATPGVQGLREEPVVDSSFIQKFTYNAATLQLTVTMKTGAEYVHFMVYPQVFEQLMQSPSKGSFYANVIKGKGPSSKVINKDVGLSRVHAPQGRAIQSNQRRSHG